MSFSRDDNPNNSFGIPGITIKATQSSPFDPYSGMDLVEQETCDHVEVMTLPDASVAGDETIQICDDPFASNGPSIYGGNAQPGRCVNSGTVNCRYLGRINNSNYTDSYINVTEFTGNNGNFQPTLTGTEDFVGSNGQIVNNYEWTGGSEGHESHVREQINSFSKYFPSNDYYTVEDGVGGNPFPNATNFDRNVGEWRSYIKTDVTGIHNFCLYVDDQVGIWMDDGSETGSNLTYVASRHSYGWHTFTHTLEADKLYRTLVRWTHHTGPEHLHITMTKPGQPTVTCSGAADSLRNNEHLLQPTFSDPAYEGGEVGYTGGDGIYYNTEDGYFPYASDDNIGNYLSNVDCNTVIDTELSVFNRMRAVCKDGSYVEMANNGDSTNTIITPIDTVVTEEGEIHRTYQIIKYDRNTTDDSNSPPGTNVYNNWSDDIIVDNIDYIHEVAVKRIRLAGDFNAGDEYLSNVTIGGVNFGNLSSDHQNQTLYDVWNGYQIITPDDNGNINYQFYATEDVSSAAGYYSWNLEVTFDVKIIIVQEDVDTYYNDFTFLSGKDACDSINNPNTELFYMSDNDLRPSLGVFATKENNVTKNNFLVTEIQNPIFTQISKPNFISNGDGRIILENEFKIDSLGLQSFKPYGGWDYIAMDGVGYGFATTYKPESVSRWEQSLSISFVGEEASDVEEQFGYGIYGYAGFAPYLVATEGNTVVQPAGELNDTDITTPSTLGQDYQWATWQKSNECYSYGRCLRFRADSSFWDTEVLHVHGDIEEDVGLTYSTLTPHSNILGTVNQNQYRTINQYQKINSFGENKINPYGSLEVSFWMKTMDDEFLELSELPEVESSIINVPPHPKENIAGVTGNSWESDFNWSQYQTDSGQNRNMNSYYSKYNTNIGYVGSTTYDNSLAWINDAEDVMRLFVGPHNPNTFRYINQDYPFVLGYDNSPHLHEGMSDFLDNLDYSSGLSEGSLLDSSNLIDPVDAGLLDEMKEEFGSRFQNVTENHFHLNNTSKFVFLLYPMIWTGDADDETHTSLTMPFLTANNHKNVPRPSDGFNLGGWSNSEDQYPDKIPTIFEDMTLLNAEYGSTILPTYDRQPAKNALIQIEEELIQIRAVIEPWGAYQFNFEGDPALPESNSGFFPYRIFIAERGVMGTAGSVVDYSEHSGPLDVHIWNPGLGQMKYDSPDQIPGNLMFQFDHGKMNRNLINGNRWATWGNINPTAGHPFSFDEYWWRAGVGFEEINGGAFTTSEYPNGPIHRIYTESPTFDGGSDYLYMCSYVYEKEFRLGAYSTGGTSTDYAKADISLGWWNFHGIGDEEQTEPSANAALNNNQRWYPTFQGSDQTSAIVGDGTSRNPKGCKDKIHMSVIPALYEPINTGFEGAPADGYLFNRHGLTLDEYINIPGNELTMIYVGQSRHPERDEDGNVDPVVAKKSGMDTPPPAQGAAGYKDFHGEPIMIFGDNYDPGDGNDTGANMYFERYRVIHLPTGTSQGSIPDFFRNSYNEDWMINLTGVDTPIGQYFYHNENIDESMNGNYNSKYSIKNELTINLFGEQSYGFGSMARFKNSAFNTWQQFSYTFNTNENSVGNQSVDRVDDLYFLIQAGNNFKGTVYIDDIKVTESDEFTPDCDVRKRKSDGTAGLADLTQYYDKIIEPQKYLDSQAPLEVQFYFYPRYIMENPLNPNSANNIIYNDYRNGMFYIYDIDWGDGSEREYSTEAEQLLDNKIIYHTYEAGGIYEVNGTMIRMKADEDYNAVGVTSHKRFTLRINIEEGSDEDFKYFGSDGFSFIPYKNTLPVIGGYSEQSIYYKSVKRNLGILTGENVNTQFESVGDRLKTELALSKMTNEFDSDLKIVPAFKQLRYAQQGSPDEIGLIALTGDSTSIPFSCANMGNYDTDPTPHLNVTTTNAPYTAEQCCALTYGDNPNDYSVIETEDWPDVSFFNLAPYNYKLYQCNLAGYDLIYTGKQVNSAELGSSVGDMNLLSIRYFNKPKQIWDMLGFTESKTGAYSMILGEDTGNPGKRRYWKNIIPEGYDIFKRNGTNSGPRIDIHASFDWSEINQELGYNNTYYYPVLPKYNALGEFIDGVYPDGNIPYPVSAFSNDNSFASITDEGYTDENLIISIGSQMIENNVLVDTSGNNNYGFAFIDYQPEFDNTTLKPNKTRNIDIIRTSKYRGAF
tara:strand:- start:42 stop:6527 length:6486 start_codon:yes stop_codon:yes gene_type:complete